MAALSVLSDTFPPPNSFGFVDLVCTGVVACVVRARCMREAPMYGAVGGWVVGVRERRNFARLMVSRWLE